MIMLLAVIGTGSFFLLEYIENMQFGKKPNKKTAVTTLTDLELKPIE